MEPASRSLRRVAVLAAAPFAVALIMALLSSAPAVALDGSFTGQSRAVRPTPAPKVLSCDAARAKLKKAKHKLAKAKKALKKAKKSGKKAKAKKAKKKVARAKKAVKRAKKQLKGCEDGGPPSGGDAQKVANEVLSQKPHEPADIDLFPGKWPNGATGIYPQAAPVTAAPGPVLGETQVRSQLSTYLRERFGAGSPEVGAGLAIFDDPATKVLAPDPMPRAALVGLKGTLMEPALDYFLNSGNFIEMRVGSLPNVTIIAGTAGGAGGQIITINERDASENFRALIPTIGHEILHGGDNQNSPAKETINHALTGMAWMQLLSRFPELAFGESDVPRANNTDAMLFVNSRERGSPDSEIYAPSGSGVAPGSPFNDPDMWTVFGSSGSSPASPMLIKILPSLGLPKPSQFNQATAETFENLNDKWLSDVQRLQVAVLLQMTSLDDITSVSGLSQKQAIDLLGLQPYLDAIG